MLPLPLRDATVQRPLLLEHRLPGLQAHLFAADSLHVTAPSLPTPSKPPSPKAVRYLPLDVKTSRAEIKLLAPAGPSSSPWSFPAHPPGPSQLIPLVLPSSRSGSAFFLLLRPQTLGASPGPPFASHPASNLPTQPWVQSFTSPTSTASTWTQGSWASRLPPSPSPLFSQPPVIPARLKPVHAAPLLNPQHSGSNPQS